MVLRKRYVDESIVSPDEFKKMLDELLLLNGVFKIGDSIPWINFMDLQGYVKRIDFMDFYLDVKVERHG